ncbi:toxic anion resistance protein [Pseudomonas cavernicola]|uniref:Toxic anion resistance protein n=1 Tax=Pseudomonas cavernicola TaxID=2320866 RepID=A0A418X9Q6_9PSED|nr:toxic anion resistance protein [Pseudomonas cavernicola]RJG09201.1 toxic anion resistance protein [Pseudomonas cavernicola]
MSISASTSTDLIDLNSAQAPAATSTVDPALVAQIQNNINLDSANAVLAFGDEVTRELGAFSSRILAQVRVKDSGEAGELLLNLTTRIQRLDPGSLEKKGFFARLFGSAQAQIDRFLRDFDDVGSQIDQVALKLEVARESMRRDIALLDQAHGNGVDFIKRLDTYISAGDGFGARFRQEELPKLQSQLAGTNESELPLLQQKIQDLQQNLDRLERKVHDLKLARMAAIQRLPQIRTVQNGDAVLMDKIHTAIHTAIPTWKAQFVTALALHRQEKAYELQQQVVDVTNELLVKNAEQLHTSAIAIEKASQKGVIDVAALRKANDLLLRTVQDVVAIQRQGRQDRVTAENELEQMESELRKTLSDRALQG